MALAASIRPDLHLLFQFFLNNGRKSAAIFLWTTNDSQALQTPILWLFALKIISRAIWKSADSSTKIWQFPVPVWITGTVLFSTTVRGSVRLRLWGSAHPHTDSSASVLSVVSSAGIFNELHSILWQSRTDKTGADPSYNSLIGLSGIASTPLRSQHFRT